ncbi:MAG: CPBP family intramembrane metalloprotease [Hyphomicrobiaceae bacterium]|nr:CPBP family intramembrane metalloprotease [Hyphomicrobiaceae bacterium]MCC0023747.1 CPBP family intramembrane metalloprotease [Hyphomicrobiaceae bacterium]
MSTLTMRMVLFYGLTLLLSWGYWLGLIAQNIVVEPGSTASHLPGLMGPMIAAFVITLILDGWTELRSLAARCFTIPDNWPAAIMAIALPPVLLLACYLLIVASGGAWPSLQAFLDYPGIPQATPALASLVLVIVLNGYGEEVGWRGFMLERLLPRLGPFRATLLLAPMWLFWHLPLFWLTRPMMDMLGPMLAGWAIGLLLGAFVFTYLYVTFSRSLLVVALWHTAYNLSVATFAARGLPAALISTLVMLLGLWVAVHFWRLSGTNPEQAEEQAQ